MGWTAITTDTSWQELAIAQEIATAYNKRVAALTASEQTATGVVPITPDENMTVFDFVSAIQNGIEAMARCWGDKNRTLIGTVASTLLFTNFASVAEMMTAAGLTASGYWRRIGEGGTQPDGWTAYTAPGWSYGKITDKDLAGPWLWIDLETALTALTRRYSNGTGAFPFSSEGYHAEFEFNGYQVSEPSPGALTWETGSGQDGYLVHKWMENGSSNPVDPNNCYRILYLTGAYTKYTVTGMSEESKTVTLYGVYNFYWSSMFSNVEGSPSWTPGMGLGLGELQEGESLVVALDSYTGADDSATLKSIQDLSSWSISGYVPWPATAYDNGQSQNTEMIYVTILAPVIDYHFDP